MALYEYTGAFGSFDDYNTFALKKHTVAELRKEYRKVRREAKARIKAMQDAGFGDARILQNKEYLKKDPSYMRKADLIDSVVYTVSFIGTDKSTPKGYQDRIDKTIEKMQALGYKGINKKNYKEFGQYMDDMRAFIDAQILTSKRAVKLFEKASQAAVPDSARDIVGLGIEKNISLSSIEKNMDFYRQYQGEIQSIYLNPDRAKPYSTREVEKILKRKGLMK